MTRKKWRNPKRRTRKKSLKPETLTKTRKTKREVTRVTAKEVPADLAPVLAEPPVLVQSPPGVVQDRDLVPVLLVPNPVVAADPQIQEDRAQVLVNRVPEVGRALVAEVRLQINLGLDLDQIVVHESLVVEVEVHQLLRRGEVDQINQNHARARDLEAEAAAEVAQIPEVEAEVARQCRGNPFREAKDLAVARMTSKLLFEIYFKTF